MGTDFNRGQLGRQLLADGNWGQTLTGGNWGKGKGKGKWQLFAGKTGTSKRGFPSRTLQFPLHLALVKNFHEDPISLRRSTSKIVIREELCNRLP